MTQSTAIRLDPSLMHDRLRPELEEQRLFRRQQLAELTVEAGAASGSQLEVTRALTSAATRVLNEIDAALDRLDAGVYGTCERCFEPIAEARLEAVPTSRCCTDCQLAAEADRALFRPGSRW